MLVMEPSGRSRVIRHRDRHDTYVNSLNHIRTVVNWILIMAYSLVLFAGSLNTIALSGAVMGWSASRRAEQAANLLFRGAQQKLVAQETPKPVSGNVQGGGH